MKKYLIILLIIVVTIICTIWIKDSFFKSSSFSPTIYQSSVNYDNFSDDISLQSKDLKLTLKGIFQNELNKEQLTNLEIEDATADKIASSSKDSMFNVLVEISNLNNSGISEINLDYLIYDNAGNILMTPIVYNRQNSKMNQFIKYFVDKEYNSKDIHEFNNHKLLVSTYSSVYNSSNNDSKLILFTSNSLGEQTNLDLSKIHILLMNPIYKDNKTSNSFNLDNTIFEFIVEN